MIRSLRNPACQIHYTEGTQCPYCLVSRSYKTKIKVKHAKVEFEDGAVPATVETWQCPECLFRVLADGAARGVIFQSCYTIYSRRSCSRWLSTSRGTAALFTRHRTESRRSRS